MAADTVISPSSIRNELLRRLSKGRLERLLPDLEPIDLPSRQMLQNRGEPVEFAYFPQSAVVSFVVVLQDGGTVEVGMVGKEGLIGAGIVLGDEIAAHDAMAQIPGQALRIPSGKLQDAVRSDVGLQQRLLRYLHVFQFQLAQTAACNAVHDVDQRCARWILVARDKVGSDQFPLTHEFLAMMLSVRRAGVTTAAGLLEKAGLIENRRGKITIVDLDGLKEVACECHRLIKEQEERLVSGESVFA